MSEQPGKRRPVIGLPAVFIVAFLFCGIAVLSIRTLINDGISPAKGQRIVLSDTPRNDRPMGDLTPHFKRMVPVVEMPGHKRQLTYFLHEPRGPYPDGVRFPLVLVLHGAPGNAYAAKYLIHPDAEVAFPAFVMVPAIGKKRTWILPQDDATENPNFALPEIVRVIETMKAQYPIDDRRIYVVGCSEGGTGAFGAALYYPHIFAASVPIMASWNPAMAEAMNKTPMWVITGSKDTDVPPENARNIAAIAKANGGDVKYTEYEDMGHECPSPALYRDPLWEWMFSHRLRQTP